MAEKRENVNGQHWDSLGNKRNILNLNENVEHKNVP